MFFAHSPKSEGSENTKIPKNLNEAEFTLYESVRELGEDDGDNGCRNEDDTDEAFGMFLIQAYKDGNSKDIYHEFEDGNILAVTGR